MDKQELKATLSVALLYVVRMLGLFMVLPVLPMALEQSPLWTGIALGAYGLSQAVLQIPLGLLSDKFGRKPIIVCGLLMFIAGSLVAAYAAQSGDVLGIVIGRLLQGCGAIASTLLALLSDVTRASNRSKSMAIVGMSIGSSFGIALVLGPVIYKHFGLEGVFLATALFAALGLVVLLTVVKTPAVQVFNPESQFSRNRLSEVLSNGKLTTMVFGIFVLHYLLMASFVVFPKLLQATGEIANDEHHLVYLMMLILTFVLMGPFMWLSDKPKYVKPMLLTMIGLFIISSSVFSQSQQYYPVIVAMVLFFMAFNLMEVILPSMVSKFAPAGARGTAMGAYSSAQFAGAFFGGIVGGYLVSNGSIAHLMYVNIAICIVWFVLAYLLPKMTNVQTLVWSFDDARSLGHNVAQDSLALEDEFKTKLLAVAGVLELALVDSIAYLKVDGDQLDENRLTELKVLYAAT